MKRALAIVEVVAVVAAFMGLRLLLRGTTRGGTVRCYRTRPCEKIYHCSYEISKRFTRWPLQAFREPAAKSLRTRNKHMARAIWNDAVVAESEATVVVEGNHYFPPDSVRWDHLSASESQSTCPWKGEASYYHVEAGGERVDDAAWTYPEPKPAASEIKGHVAFWKGVLVEP